MTRVVFRLIALFPLRTGRPQHLETWRPACDAGNALDALLMRLRCNDVEQVLAQSRSIGLL